MKRSEALAPLSRDHHRSLILAQLLKKDAPAYKGLPTDAAGKTRYALALYEDEIRMHFSREEEALNKIKGQNKEIDQLAEEIRAEHQKLTDLFGVLQHDTVDQSAMNELGNALEAHIRKEERNLFPLIEKYCPEEILQQIHALLH